MPIPLGGGTCTLTTAGRCGVPINDKCAMQAKQEHTENMKDMAGDLQGSREGKIDVPSS
jgi:hypothetical protein